MLSDPVLTLTCDDCQATEEIGLTPIARGGYDERNVRHRIDRLGWLTVGRDTHYCPECRAEHEAKK